MATIHNSKYLRADIRVKTAHEGCETYTNQHAGSFICRDIFLQADKSVVLETPGYEQNIIFPIAGSVMLTAEGEKELSPGDVYFLPKNMEGTLRVKNPFQDETINFLYIGINNETEKAVETPTLCGLTLTTKNKLTSGDGIANAIKVGVYGSGTEDTMKATQKGNSIFSYIINGSFEVEGRLMEYRDGLLQWDVAAIEFEALSETAILLLIEYSTKK